ncbi:MFS transporter [Desulfitobacterium sp. THU1]|uniref:MFS transporter n=1 Tax=Desulfitobacterium sp. THU1 TaxID=3138072 RepID=UPI00311E9E0F
MSLEINPGKETLVSGGPKVKKLNNYFDGLPVSRQHLFLFIIIVLSYFFEQMDNNNFSFIAPALIKGGFFQQHQLATITSTYFLGMTLGGLLGGFVSDAIGRRKTFLLAMLIFSSMSILNGITSNFTVFVFARAATGFGIFMMMVTSIAYIAEMAPGESRGKWQSLTAAGGFMAMPAIGFISRAIIPTGPEAWRIIFYLGGLGFISFVLGFKYLKESPRWLVSKGRIAEAEKVVEELSGVAVDLSEAAKHTPPKVSFVEQFSGMFKGKYLKRTLILLGFGIPINIASFATSVWTPTLLTMKGFTLEQSLTIGTAFMLGGPVGLFLSSPFSDKGGRKIPIAIGVLAGAITTVIFASLGNTYMVVMVVAFMLNALGMGTGFIAMAYVPEHYPTKMRNTAVGIVNACQRLGVSASQLFIPLIMAGYGFKGLYLGIAGLMTFAGLFILALGARTGGKPLEEID